MAKDFWLKHDGQLHIDFPELTGHSDPKDVQALVLGTDHSSGNKQHSSCVVHKQERGYGIWLSCDYPWRLLSWCNLKTTNAGDQAHSR